MVPTDNKIEQKEEKQVPKTKLVILKQTKKTQNVQKKEKRIWYIEVKFIKIGQRKVYKGFICDMVLRIHVCAMC